MESTHSRGAKGSTPRRPNRRRQSLTPDDQHGSSLPLGSLGLPPAVLLHDAFVGAGCEERMAPQPAVSIEAGAIWRHVYNEVTTRGDRYVQGGGCLTVGVAGLIQGGGFGSSSK